MNARAQILTVRTPEGVVFATRLAGPVTRFLAWGVDLLCILILSNVIGLIATLIGFVSPDLAQAISIILMFVITLSYSILLEWFWRGQTVGKRLLRLRVVDLEGMRLQPSQVVVRNLLRAVDFLPAFYVVGGLACLLNRHAQRLGDIAANTVVIRMPRLDTPDVEQLLAGKFNSLRQHPHLEARLRQRVTPAEADLALRALLRRDDFEPAARVRLFSELAAHFRELVSFPPDASEGLTDEQYVRNVVDSLFRKRASATARAEQPVVESKAEEPAAIA
jgi:uncharacterized RDD family membrane protein YckC